MQTMPFTAANGSTMANNIEVVGFLTAPGTLEIDVGATTQTLDVPAGIQAFTIPLVEGTPTFKLTRDGSTVVTLTSATAIDNTITYQDPLYHAGASLTCTPPDRDTAFLVKAFFMSPH